MKEVITSLAGIIWGFVLMYNFYNPLPQLIWWGGLSDVVCGLLLFALLLGKAVDNAHKR